MRLYSSVQYSVQRFSISCSSVRHFPERSWAMVTFPRFTVVKSFTSWYVILLLFFLRLSSILLHSSPTKFSVAFFMHFLVFCSLSCIAQILQVHFCFLSFSGLSFCRTGQESLMSVGGENYECMQTEVKCDVFCTRFSIKHSRSA